MELDSNTQDKLIKLQSVHRELMGVYERWNDVESYISYLLSSIKMVKEKREKLKESIETIDTFLYDIYEVTVTEAANSLKYTKK